MDNLSVFLLRRRVSKVESAKENTNDFSKGSIIGNMARLAIPMTLAQIINVLYNIVDRIYIGENRRTFGKCLYGAWCMSSR